MSIFKKSRFKSAARVRMGADGRPAEMESQSPYSMIITPAGFGATPRNITDSIRALEANVGNLPGVLIPGGFGPGVVPQSAMIASRPTAATKTRSPGYLLTGILRSIDWGEWRSVASAELKRILPARTLADIAAALDRGRALTKPLPASGTKTKPIPGGWSKRSVWSKAVAILKSPTRANLSGGEDLGFIGAGVAAYVGQEVLNSLERRKNEIDGDDDLGLVRRYGSTFEAGKARYGADFYGSDPYAARKSRRTFSGRVINSLDGCMMTVGEGEEAGVAGLEGFKKFKKKLQKVVKKAAKQQAIVASGGVHLLLPKKVQKKVEKVPSFMMTGGTDAIIDAKNPKDAFNNLMKQQMTIMTGGQSLLLPPKTQKELQKVFEAHSTVGLSVALKKIADDKRKKMERMNQQAVEEGMYEDGAYADYSQEAYDAEQAAYMAKEIPAGNPGSAYDPASANYSVATEETDVPNMGIPQSITMPPVATPYTPPQVQQASPFMGAPGMPIPATQGIPYSNPAPSFMSYEDQQYDDSMPESAEEWDYNTGYSDPGVSYDDYEGMGEVDGWWSSVRDKVVKPVVTTVADKFGYGGAAKDLLEKKNVDAYGMTVPQQAAFIPPPQKDNTMLYVAGGVGAIALAALLLNKKK